MKQPLSKSILWMKGPLIVGEGCFIGAHAYLRGGAFLDKNVKIGPGCEIKMSIILPYAALAHFNFVGDSIVGSYVNMGSRFCHRES